MNDIIEVKQADMLQAINRAEVDIQIATEIGRASCRERV